MGVLALALLYAWRRWPHRRRATFYGLVVLTSLMLFGAVTSIFPLPFWPFYPEQSLNHYLAHAAWMASSLALLIVLIGWRRQLTAVTEEEK